MNIFYYIYVYVTTILFGVGDNLAIGNQMSDVANVRR